MTMSLKGMLELIEDIAQGQGQGAALYYVADKNRMRDLTPAQQTFVREAWESRKDRKKTEPMPVHPETQARLQPRDEADLTPAELVWLQRLPTDPTKVRFEDATVLAALSTSVKGDTAPTSKRLIESIWQPVKALHDARCAEAQLARAKAAVPSVPDSASAALGDAIGAEYDGLGPEAQRVEAVRIFTEHNARMQERYDRSVERATQELERARQAVEQTSDIEREMVG